MANTQLTQTRELITGMLLAVAFGVVAIGALSFVVARRFGGQSKLKRQVIFTLLSGIGFLSIYLVYMRMSGHA